mgnify:CR=1 FL=1
MSIRTKPVKALIFSVSIGSGHDSVAQALAERLLLEAPGSEVKIVDTFQYINRVLNKVVFGSYMETIRFTPKVWGYLYDQAEDGERLVDLGQILSKLLSPKLEQLLTEVNPDVVLATHAFPTGILAVGKKRGQVKVPLVTAVTDFHVHSFWIHESVDRYFIPADDLGFRLRQTGIREERIKAVGIPIRSQFMEAPDAVCAKEELGLNASPAILVMGGGLGLGRIELITRELLNDGTFQVIVIAGKNKRLYGNLQGLNNPRLKVYSYVDNIAHVMAAADIIISKPGGVSSAEILALGKPLVIYSSLPGQEDRNADYLLNKGVAVKVRKMELLLPELMSLWNNSLRIKHMKEMAGQIGSPSSSKLVWDDIFALIGNKE